MSQRIAIFIILATFLALAFGAGEEVGGPQPPPTPETTTPTTTTPTTTTPTTTTPTTTTPTTTTPTTTTPTTTTPSTTTPSTTTTTTSKTTTTATTTTTGAPSTTPAPHPVPKPDVGKWSVFDSVNNVTCIILDMAIQLNVSYPKSANETGHVVLNVPGNETTSSGTCGNVTQLITLTWKGLGVKDNHTLQFTFEQNTTSKHFQLTHILVTLNANVTEFPEIQNVTKLDLHNDQKEFSTTIGMSYRCSKAQLLNLTSGDASNVTVAMIKISEVQFESFHTKHEDNFSAAEDCEHSNTPDIVPIAVGCALVGLVAIVLIAYLVGRRRSQARGYLSM